MTPQENIQHIWDAPLAFMVEHRIPVSETSQTTSNSIDLRLVYISDWDMLAWGFISLLNSHCLRSITRPPLKVKVAFPGASGCGQPSKNRRNKVPKMLCLEYNSVSGTLHDFWAKSEQFCILYGALQVWFGIHFIAPRCAILSRWNQNPPVSRSSKSVGPILSSGDLFIGRKMLNTSAVVMRWLSGWWFQTWILFSISYEWIIIPIDFHIFQDGYCTTKQVVIISWDGWSMGSIDSSCILTGTIQRIWVKFDYIRKRRWTFVGGKLSKVWKTGKAWKHYIYFVNKYAATTDECCRRFATKFLFQNLNIMGLMNVGVPTKHPHPGMVWARKITDGILFWPSESSVHLLPTAS